MIKFFRKIRQNMIKENKVSKYLLYAIGEIVLVVIGILIAIQINNWNINQKDREEEKEILKSLKVDLEGSKEGLELTIKRQKEVLNRTAKLINLIQKNKSGINLDTLFKSNIDSINVYLKRGALLWWRAESITGTYDALLGSGKTELLLNSELKRKLAKHFTWVKYGFEEQENAMNLLSILSNKLSEYIPSFWSHNRSRNDSPLTPIVLYTNDKQQYKDLANLLNDKLFEGILIQKDAVEHIRFREQTNLLKSNIELIDLINSELDKTKG